MVSTCVTAVSRRDSISAPPSPASRPRTGRSWSPGRETDAMRVIVALGGNAAAGGQRADAATQVANVEGAARTLARLAEQHELIITHGNGPQVGMLAVHSAAPACPTFRACTHSTRSARRRRARSATDVQAPQNALPGRQVLAMVTQTLVTPSMPCSTSFSTTTAKFMSAGSTRRPRRGAGVEYGLSVKADGGYWRCVVPPRPLRGDRDPADPPDGPGGRRGDLRGRRRGAGDPRPTEPRAASASRRSSTRTSPPRCWPRRSTATRSRA